MTRTSVRRTTAALAVASVLALSACGNDPEVTTGATPTPSATTPDPSPLPQDGATRTPAPEPGPVPEILDFRATTVEGEPFDARTLAGRPVLVWFWAPWCAVCRSQIDDVRAYAENQDLAVVGIGSLDSSEAIAGFADDVPGVTHLSDEDGAVWKRFGITEQSSFVVLDADGTEVIRTGYSDDDGVAEAVADVTG